MSGRADGCARSSTWTALHVGGHDALPLNVNVQVFVLLPPLEQAPDQMTSRLFVALSVIVVPVVNDAEVVTTLVGIANVALVAPCRTATLAATVAAALSLDSPAHGAQRLQPAAIGDVTAGARAS